MTSESYGGICGLVQKPDSSVTSVKADATSPLRSKRCPRVTRSKVGEYASEGTRCTAGPEYIGATDAMVAEMERPLPQCSLRSCGRIRHALGHKPRTFARKPDAENGVGG